MSSSTANSDPGEPARGESVDLALLRALADPALYDGGPVQVHETHASWVFVGGDRAYKIKKPVALGFLDYSTLPLRHAACRGEVRVNRELAPGLYLGVRAIVRAADGYELAPERAPGAVEYAVAMRSFREADTLAGLIAAGALSPELLGAVAARLAEFHRKAPVVAGGGADEVLGMWRDNVRELARGGHPPGWDVELPSSFAGAFVRAHEEEIEDRRRRGLVRDGHGDLRCEHVLAIPTVRVVDRVEFDPALRRTDVACDLAFLTMDLEACGERRAAVELISAYRRRGVDPGSEALLSFYAAHRALVRAKVALVAASEREAAGEGERDAAESLAQAQALWELAERLCWRARAPVAVVVCGPAASGKSTLAAELSRRSGLPALSSDAVRKSAAGLAVSERGEPEHYSERFTRVTYELLGREARRELAHSGGVIVDATCRSRGERFLLLHRLHRAGLTRLVVRCEVPLEVALERAARRMGDPDRASDATPEIVAEQYRSFQALEELRPGSVIALDAEQPLDVQVAEVTRAVDRRLAARA
ncbi:MAG TPA: AAA family ATPase [Solirubrobacteraceae bacterium]|nr:AAA family ATPase [Solirubrobacteraceae bacterium]